MRAVAVSPSALESRFKTVMGRTIHAEIQRVQVERARQLVAATSLPLKQVAAAAGFAYVQHMTTIFRRWTGQTPGQYRKRSRPEKSVVCRAKTTKAAGTLPAALADRDSGPQGVGHFVECAVGIGTDRTDRRQARDDDQGEHHRIFHRSRPIFRCKESSYLE